jgi:hypothetical protein
MTPPVETELVKDAGTAASVLNHLRQNRIEWLLAIGLLHLLGVTDRVLGQISGVCF